MGNFYIKIESGLPKWENFLNISCICIWWNSKILTSYMGKLCVWELLVQEMLSSKFKCSYSLKLCDCMWQISCSECLSYGNLCTEYDRSHSFYIMLLCRSSWHHSIDWHIRKKVNIIHYSPICVFYVWK